MKGRRTRRTDAAPFDFSALADLCTRLGRILERRELVPLLDEAAHLFDAVGLIVWSWDASANVLRASVADRLPRARAGAVARRAD